jgi:hypothetical protein
MWLSLKSLPDRDFVQSPGLKLSVKSVYSSQPNKGPITLPLNRNPIMLLKVAFQLG